MNSSQLKINSPERVVSIRKSVDKGVKGVASEPRTMVRLNWGN